MTAGDFLEFSLSPWRDLDGHSVAISAALDGADLHL